MDIRPLHDRVVLKRDERQRHSPGGILIPDTAGEKPTEGRVMAVGKGKSFGAPIVTKDGVTVAKEIELKDKLQNMGAQLVKEVASKTADEAGDGTTTATVLAQAIVREGLKSVAAGMNPMDLKRGIDLAT